MPGSLLTALLALFAVQDQPAATTATGRISGRVLGPLAEPIAKARVELYLQDDATKLVDVAETRNSGWFRFTRVPAGSYRVRAIADNHTGDQEWTKLDGDTPARTGLLFRLWAATRVSGKVTTTDGKPIPGATVVATNDLARVLSSFDVEEVMTDDQGRFVFDHAPLGELRVRAYESGHDLAYRDVFVREPTSVDITLTQGKGSTLELAVTGLTKEQLEQCTVLLGEFLEGSRQAYPKALRSPLLDAQGQVRWTGLPAGEFSLSVHHPELSIRRPPRIQLEPGKTTAIEVAAIRPEAKAKPKSSAKVSGKLVTADGKPLAGRALALRANSVGRLLTKTASDGGFEFSFSKRPNEIVSFSLPEDDDYALDRDQELFGALDPTRNPGNLRLVAQRTATISGTVVLPGGPPARGVYVRLTGEHPPNVFPRRTSRGGARTTRDGTFTISKVVSREDEDLWLEVAGIDGVVVVKGIKLKSGDKRAGIRLLLEDPAEVRGKVTGADGRPVPGARVWLRTWNLETNRQRDGSVTEVLADAEGRYRHVGIKPGGYYVAVHFGPRFGAKVQKCEPFELGRAERKTVDLVIK